MKINGKKVKIRGLNFEVVAQIERMGIPSTKLGERPLATAVGMFAVSAGLSYDEAVKEIQAHIDGGGDILQLLDAVNAAVKQADCRGWC